MDNQQTGKRAKEIVFFIINIALAIGALVPFLVDFLVNGHMTWSIIVLGAIAMVWLITAPWFVLSSNRFVSSWTAALISVPGLLYVIESVTPAKGWFVALGMPAAMVGLAGIGIVGWLWLYSRLKFWYAASLSLFVASAVNFGENFLTRSFSRPIPLEFMNTLTAFCLLGLGCLLMMIALSAHGFNPFRTAAHE